MVSCLKTPSKNLLELDKEENLWLECKLYNNEMVRELELACPTTDFMAGHPTSVVALADLAPTVMDTCTRDVLHKIQLLLNIVEGHGRQLHMEFGDTKCKLLITARSRKLKGVENLLSQEPERLTFYGKPVSLVKESYVHIGVPQAPRQQSRVATEYRISILQHSTKNALLGVSPISNRKMFISSFLYGLDTVKLIMMAVPDNSASCAAISGVWHLACKGSERPRHSRSFRKTFSLSF